jgi:hypothetical protein
VTAPGNEGGRTVLIGDLTAAEREAFLDHLTSTRAVEAYIRDGGDLPGYIETWKAERDRRARLASFDTGALERGLSAPIQGWGTVRDYLAALLTELIVGEAGNEYGMTGNSDWRYDIYGALNRAGLVPGWEDGYGLTGADEAAAERTVAALIRYMALGR